jgi:DNA-binding FadR family transcriptional regulator
VSITAEQLAELDHIAEEMADPATGNATLFDADHRFHIAVANATGNSAIRSVVEYLWELRTRSPLCANMFDRARRNGVNPRYDEHRPILDALHARDPHGARSAMRRHLRGVVDDLLEATELELLERARNELDARRDTLAKRLEIGPA